MSQAGILSTTAGPVPPAVATSYVTDNGTAVPAANILEIRAIDVTDNNDNGVQTEGGAAQTGAANRVQVQLTNRNTDTVTTPDAALTTLITFSLGATPGSFYVWGNVQAFDSVTPAGATYSFSGGYRTDGVSATELGIEYHDQFEDVAFETADVFLSTSGNNVLLEVQGVAATSINWNGILEYRQVN